MKKIISTGIFLALIALISWGIFSLKQHKNEQNNGLVTIGKVPSFSFQNQNGVIINNQTFAGKVLVIDFFFTSCPSICPIMTSNMTQVQNAFPDNSIGIASFSIDPNNDTPEILQKYAQEKGITSPHWHLLTGDEEEIMKLANQGFNLYTAKGQDDFEHSGLFALIDQKGNIVCRKNAQGSPIVYYDGLKKEGITMLIEDIKKLQQP